MAQIQNTATEVITGVCRLSYEHIWEQHPDQNGNLKYSASVIIPKIDKETLSAIKAAVDAAKADGKAKWGGKIPKTLKLPLRDGDEDREDDPAYENAFFLNANSKIKPAIIDRSGKEITDFDRERVYSGCYCRFMLRFYPFSGQQNGVAVGLNGVQFIKDGEPFGGGVSATAAAEKFGAYDCDDDGDVPDYLN